MREDEGGREAWSGGCEGGKVVGLGWGFHDVGGAPSRVTGLIDKYIEIHGTLDGAVGSELERYDPTFADDIWKHVHIFRSV